MKKPTNQQKLSDADFKRLFGARKSTYAALVVILRKKTPATTPPRRPPKLKVADKLAITLQYLREYLPAACLPAGQAGRTMRHIAYE